MTDSVLDTLAAERIVGILRYHQSGDMRAAVEALGAGGVRILEVTIDSPDGWDTIEWSAASGRFAVGAGTVTRADDVRRAAQAGARFIISPGFVPEVVETALDIGILAIPGIMTATEALAARRAGAQALKLFPAEPLGTHYLRNLLGPLHGVPFVPTGGIGVANLREWLDAGALAVGLGGLLVGATAPSTPAEIDALRQRAADAVREAHR